MKNTKNVLLKIYYTLKIIYVVIKIICLIF